MATEPEIVDGQYREVPAEGRGAIQPLASLIQTIRSGDGSNSTEPTRPLNSPRSNGNSLPPNDGLGCTNCGREAGLEWGADGAGKLAHDCCLCADAGRVRGRAFGTSELCPGCHGTGANPEPQPGHYAQAEQARLRLPRMYRETTFERWLPANGSPRLRCQSYVFSWPPAKPFLALLGGVGTGKTTLAAAVVNAALEKHGVRGQFWPVVDLLGRLRATVDEDRAIETEAEVMGQMCIVPLLVLDDLGANKATEYVEERLFRIVDYRYRQLLPTVVTTNVPLEKLDQRIASRLSDAAVSLTVEVNGPDMRPTAKALGGTNHD